MRRERQERADDGTQEAISAFRAAIEGATSPAGRDRLHAALDAERTRERRANAHRRTLGILLGAVAALLLVSCVLLFWRRATVLRDVVVCPHGGTAGASENLREFLRDPDRFQRVCRCKPLYSGNLRRTPWPAGSAPLGREE